MDWDRGADRVAGRRRQSERLLAAAASVGATALLLGLLSSARLPIEAARRVARVGVVVLPPLAAREVERAAQMPRRVERAPLARPMPTGGSSARRESRPARTTTAALPPSPVGTGTAPDGHAEFDNSTAQAPAPAASAPLQLDAATLRNAATRGAGAVRRLADASGQALPGDTPASADRIGAGISRTGKTDCLAPNPHGTLLSIPVIAVEALTGQCK